MHHNTARRLKPPSGRHHTKPPPLVFVVPRELPVAWRAPGVRERVAAALRRQAGRVAQGSKRARGPLLALGLLGLGVVLGSSWHRLESRPAPIEVVEETPAAISVDVRVQEHEGALDLEVDVEAPEEQPATVRLHMDEEPVAEVHSPAARTEAATEAPGQSARRKQRQVKVRAQRQSDGTVSVLVSGMRGAKRGMQ